MEAAPAATGAIEGARSGTLAAAGALPQVDVPLALSIAGKGDGKGSTHKAGPAKQPERKERKTDTPEEQNAHWDKLKNSGEWEQKKGYSKSTLKNKKDGRLIQKSREKWEIEVYNEQEKHIGVIKPSDGKFHPELEVEGRTIEK